MAATELEIQDQWKRSVEVLEQTRNYFDTTLAAASGNLTLLQQALEGTFTVPGIAQAIEATRRNAGALVSRSAARLYLSPILREYGILMSEHASLGYGGNFTDEQRLWTAIYEWFVANSLTVQSRNITYDTTPTLGAGNVGNGELTRLTIDANGFDLEACHPEKKTFRCVQDVNSGVSEQAEVFEVVGERGSPLGLERLTTGSGVSARVRSRHAGSGAATGGSLLRNSSFSAYSSSATASKFEGWVETFGGSSVIGDVTQDATNYYRKTPTAATGASLALAMDNAADSIKLAQPLSSLPGRRLDASTPYFFRIMWNRSTLSATGGNLIIRMGSVSATVAVSAQSGWQELMIAVGANSWFETFNEADLTFEIEWDGGTAGTLLIDDVILAPFDLIDGTWWFIRANAATHTPWLRDDTIQFTDTQPGPQTEGKVQFWAHVAGYGYLPSTGSPTMLDP